MDAPVCPSSSWSLPECNLPDPNDNVDAVLNLCRRPNSDDPHLDIMWLRTSVLPCFEKREPSKGSNTLLALHVANNNLRRDGGGEHLANLLLSLLHKATLAADDRVRRTFIPVVCDLDVSCSGAFDDVRPWIRYFDACLVSPLGVQRLRADDEILRPSGAASLLSAIGRCCSTTLTHLSLRRCLLSSENIRTLSDGLRYCTAPSSSSGPTHGAAALSHLDLRENDISSLGLELLATTLRDVDGYRQGLRSLLLGRNCVSLGAPNVKTQRVYCRRGLLCLAELVLRAPKLVCVDLEDNELGSSYDGWPAGSDHGGVSEVCEAARRSLACKAVDERKPAVILLRGNEFSAQTRESLHRCSGFTATLQ